MGAFEDFVNLELPRRSALLTVENTGYDGDPNDGGAPSIFAGAPKGTWYLRETPSGIFYRKNPASVWEEGGGGGGGSSNVRATTAALIFAVNGSTGSDAPSEDRPEGITGGDYSAFPFATIQAAVNAVPIFIQHSVTINVVQAGNYAGFSIGGFYTRGQTFAVNGLQAQVTPTSGPATGTASSGTSKSLTLTGAGWTVDNFQGKFCRIISGQGAGQRFIIATNTADTLYFAGRMSPVPNNTSVFEITEPKTIITSNAALFPSGFYHTSSLGYFSVSDFHIEGPSYGCVQLGTQSVLSLYRVTQKNGYYGFICQDSMKAAYNQIGSLASTNLGLGYLNVQMAGNTGYEKGWLILNAGAGADGLWFNGCNVGGCQGVFVKGCGNNGFRAYQSEVTLYYSQFDNNLDGVWCEGSRVFLYYTEANNNTKRGYASDYGGRLDLQGTIAGSGNGEWGVHAGVGVGGIVTATTLPTVTGTLGDATVDGVNALTWATDFATKNDYASFLPRQALIVRAA